MDIRIPVKNALDLVSPSAASKNIELISDVPSIAIMLDEDMIHTVLQNLLSNAIKYSLPGSTVRISADEHNGLFSLKIKDEGIGMDEETLQKLFQIGEGLTLPGTNGEKGTGLGLILSKEFVERHRGRILVESEKGKGSSFTIEIPL
jgi:signal transduction histidine kinase